jgi:hypothetical protein
VGTFVFLGKELGNPVHCNTLKYVHLEDKILGQKSSFLTREISNNNI